MAFSSTLVKRQPFGEGYILEKYTWNGASVTTGTITPDTTDAEGIGLIKEIDVVSYTDNANAVRAAYSSDVSFASVALTFTSNDTGTLTIIGKAR